VHTDRSSLVVHVCVVSLVGRVLLQPPPAADVMSNIHGLSSKKVEKKENEEEYTQGAAGQRYERTRTRGHHRRSRWRQPESHQQLRLTESCLMLPCVVCEVARPSGDRRTAPHVVQPAVHLLRLQTRLPTYSRKHERQYTGATQRRETEAVRRQHVARAMVLERAIASRASHRLARSLRRRVCV
jgi:hypothetical protein